MKRYINEYWPYALALFPVLLLRDFSPASELRYVSMASEMLKSNHFFCLTWQGENYYNEMPLLVWLIALLKVVFRHHYMITIAGLLSFIPSMAILAIMNRWVERFDTSSFRLKDGSQSRILASVMLFTCGLQAIMSFTVSPDMLFSLWIVSALYTFWRIISEQGAYGPSPDQKVSRRLQFQFGLFVFLAVFTKGPIGFAIILMSTTIYLLCSGKIARWTKVWNWRGWLVLLSLISIWLWATYLEGGMEWIEKMMMHQPLSLLLHPANHDRPWFYYFITLWADTLPWGPLSFVVLVISLIRRIHHKVFRWKKPFETPLQNFFVTTWLVALFYFSVQRHKLEVHMLPAYPFLVYAAVMQFGQWRWPIRWNWRLIWICRYVLFTIFLVGILCPWLNIYTVCCYGRVSYRANRIARELHTEGTYVYGLPRAKGMDAYLHHDPIVATPQDVAEGKLQNTLLIMKENKTDQYFDELTRLGVPQSQQGEIIDELGAYIILYYR